jgi:hypothetical protein
MKAKLVTWSGVATSSIGTWTYSPIEYWQVSNSNWDKVSFFAYIPSISGSLDVTFVPAKAADVNENPKLYCTIPPGLTPGQVDLVVDAEYNVTHDTDNGKVKFKFDHVLSRIEFKAQLKNDYAPATVTMSSLTFYYNGLKRSGTYEFNSGNGNGDDKNNKAGKWEVTNGRQGGNTENLLAFSTVTATLNSTKPLDIPPGSARYLMLIPQENAFEQAYVTVSYTIDYPPGHDPPTETVNEKAYLPPTTWEPGIAYSYTLNIAALKEMIFDVNKVEDWSNWKDNPIPIDIPDTPP